MASDEPTPSEPPVEAAKIENDQLFRLMIANVRDYAIFMLDTKGYVATWNLGAERIKGYTADEIIGKHFSVFYPQLDIDSGKCEMELDVATREGRYEDLGWRVRKDGSQFWANVVISAIRDESGRLVGFSKVTRDLTDRKRAEDEQLGRLEAEERYRYLVESVRDYAIFMLDPMGYVATWNIGAERIKQYRPDEIIGAHFSKFYLPEDVAAGKCEHELRMAASEGRFEDEGWRVRKDGTRFWANVVISAVRDRHGDLVGFAKITRDLTERRRAEDDRAARVAAEQASRTKDEFLAMLGHEMRNPLAPILTALQLIKLRGDDNAVKEHAIIERQVTHMMHLVDDLLDVSRITKGKLELKRRPVDLRIVLGKAIEIASPLLEQRSHKFDLDIPAEPIGVEGDEARLTQVVANLLTNAAKYTDHGGNIRVAVSLHGDRVQIDVSDNGTGIAPELLPHVFELFVQGSRTLERSSGGLGLGLTLVRKLVELHGGEVTAYSEGIGRGSTFTLCLPRIALDTVDAGDRRTSRIATVKPRRVMIVDDNEDALVLLAEALTAAGHVVETSTDPARALQLIDEFKPDFAILDIGMPLMDGYELAEKIRAKLDRAAPRMFALTGFGQQTDREKSREAGFAAHFVKPVDVRQLIASIADS
ncbi:MAG TPA: PAS domain S-box protein [Kofleriaceae bacterium]